MFYSFTKEQLYFVVNLLYLYHHALSQVYSVLSRFSNIYVFNKTSNTFLLIILSLNFVLFCLQLVLQIIDKTGLQNKSRVFIQKTKQKTVLASINWQEPQILQWLKNKPHMVKQQLLVLQHYFSNWSIRSNPEGRINRKPEGQNLTRGPNKQKTERLKMTIRPKIELV